MAKMTEAQKMEKKMKREEEKRRIKLATIESYCQQNSLELTSSIKDQVSINKLVLMHKKEQLFRTEHQRGWEQVISFIIKFLNDMLHGIDCMIPIYLFILKPKGMPDIKTNAYLTCPKKYIDLGYKMYIVDGSQRIRTIIAFLQGMIPLPILFDQNYKGEFDKDTKKELKTVKNVYFDELPKKIQEKFKNFSIKFVSYQSSKMEEYQLVFEAMNRHQKKLTDVELYNNKYGDTKLFQKALEYVDSMDMVELFNLNPEKCHNMRKVDKESYMKKSDGGSALMGVLKIMLHANTPEADDSTISMVEHFLKQNKDQDISAVIEKFDYIHNICKKLNPKIYGSGKRSENRIRSVYAAVSMMDEKAHGILEENMDNINEVIEDINYAIPSSQDSAGTKSNINTEIAMYVGFFRYICKEFDDTRYNYTLKTSLSVKAKKQVYDLYTVLENYYYEKSKKSA